jgi:hypothetical protein
MRTLYLMGIIPAAVAGAFAQSTRAPVPGYEAYLQVENTIATPEPVQAPRREVSLKGVQPLLPASRTPESVRDEVRENQARLAYLYKKWSFTSGAAAGSSKFALSLSILPSGQVAEAAVTGPKDKALRDAVRANVLTWTFSPVKDPRPFAAKLRNLDFRYGRTVAAE